MRIQIIPNINIDNKKVIGLVENIHHFKPLAKRFYSDEKYIGFKSQSVIAFETVLSANDTSFYISFDDKLKENIMTELNICWPKATYKKATPIFMRGETRELELAEHWFLSLKTDLRGEFPLSNILETQNILKEEESILIRLEISPISSSWAREQEECIKAFEEGQMPQKGMISARSIATQATNGILKTVYFFIDFINELVSSEEIKHEYICNNKYDKLNRLGLSSETQQKSRYNAYATNISVTVNPKRADRREALFGNIFKAFHSMTGDNKFLMVEKSRYKNILCSKEIAQIVQLPTKTYQEMYLINNINNREIDVPNSLLDGKIKIGTSTYKGIQNTTYWPDNKNILPLPKIVVGPMGSGKSEYTKNFAVQAARKGDSVIVFDYIQNCELSNDISKYVDCIKINLSKKEHLMALAYPELQPTGDNWSRLKVANILSRQTEYLINSLSPEPLTPRMSRYLDAACKVVYIHTNAKVNDVIDVLINWKTRNEYIRKAKYSGIFKEDDLEIQDLLSLHERDATGKIVGTRENKLEGIMDRINILMKDIYLRAMCKADIDYSRDFCRWMDKGKVILIQMPQNTFSNKQVNDTIVTYFMSRIWLAALQRKSNKIVHVITDEIHQVPTAAKFVSNIITETRKFGVGFYFTIHYLKQFKALHDAIRSAGASYMLLAGTEKENLLALEEEISPFTVTEGLNLKPFHSLNIINYGNQYTKFISKMPKPIK